MSKKNKGNVTSNNNKTKKKSGSFNFFNKAKELQEDKVPKEQTTYDSMNVTGPIAGESRTTEAALTRGAELYGDANLSAKKSMKEQYGVENNKENIQKSKNVSSMLFVAATASKAIPTALGGQYISAALNMAQTMAKAYTANLKFKELMYDTMTILTNCYKIFSLINRSTDVFLIAIHNPKGLNTLFTLLLQRSEKEKTLDRMQIDNHQKEYEKAFVVALKDAQTQKEINRRNLQKHSGQDIANVSSRLLEEDPHYLLYNIHQSSEIKEEIKRKMKDLMGLLLESAPDDVILTLFLDKTLKNRGIGDAVAAECLRRRTEKGELKQLERNITGEYVNKDEIVTFEEILTTIDKKNTWLVSVSNTTLLENIKKRMEDKYATDDSDKLLDLIFYIENVIYLYGLGKKNEDEQMFCHKPGNNDENEKRIKQSQLLGAVGEDRKRREFKKQLEKAAKNDEYNKKSFMGRRKSNFMALGKGETYTKAAKSIGKGAMSLGKAMKDPQTYLYLAKQANEITGAEEKMMDVLTALSVINGLFIVMKAQYDEAMRYYEKHLDIIIETDVKNEKDDTPKSDRTSIGVDPKRYNIYVRGGILPTLPGDKSMDQIYPTTFEMANYMIELSPEYINFLVPPSLQSIMNEAINQTSSDVIDSVMEAAAEEATDDAAKAVKSQEEISDKMTDAEEAVGTSAFYENAKTANVLKKKKGGKSRRRSKNQRKRRSTRKSFYRKQK
jgi:hypothetical protein